MSALVGSKPKPKQPVAVVPKPPTTLRRFVIRAHEYDKVLSWLKRKSKEEDIDDEKLAEVKEKEFTMPADYLPKIVWAHKRPLKIRKGPHGKEYVAVLEKGAQVAAGSTGQSSAVIRQRYTILLLVQPGQDYIHLLVPTVCILHRVSSISIH